MSDYWPGPGWRRADDGKWYPDPAAAPPPPPAPPGAAADQPLPPPPPGAPTAPSAPPPASATPGALPPPPPDVYPGATPGASAAGYPGAPTGPDMWAPQLPLRPVPGSLSGWLQGLFWLIAASSVLILLTTINARSAFDDLDSSTGTFGDYQSWNDADGLVGLASVFYAFARLALFVVIIVWAWRCHKAAAGLNPGPRRWAAGWTIGGWFIPFASIVIPEFVLDETERIAMAPRSNGTAMNWKAVKVSRIGIGWWWLFILSSFLAVFAGNTDTSIGAFADPDGVRTYYTLLMASSAAAAVSAVLGALYTKEVSVALGLQGLYGGAATSRGGHAHRRRRAVGRSGHAWPPAPRRPPPSASVPRAPARPGHPLPPLRQAPHPDRTLGTGDPVRPVGAPAPSARPDGGATATPATPAAPSSTSTGLGTDVRSPRLADRLTGVTLRRRHSWQQVEGDPNDRLTEVTLRRTPGNRSGKDPAAVPGRSDGPRYCAGQRGPRRRWPARDT